MEALVYLALLQILEAVINHIENKKCEGDREMNGEYLSKELEIFDAAEKDQKCQPKIH